HRTRRDRHARALALHAPERRPRARGERLVHARVRLRASTAAISSAATTPVPGSSRFVAAAQLAQPARLGLGPKYPSACISGAGSPPAAAYLTRVDAGLIATASACLASAAPRSARARASVSAACAVSSRSGMARNAVYGVTKS